MNIYSLLHYIVILLVLLLPFILCNTKHLLIYIILVALIVLHWKFNNNECILTNLEKNYYPDDSEDKDQGFITKHLNDLGLQSITQFEYFTEVIALSLIIFVAIKTYLRT